MSYRSRVSVSFGAPLTPAVKWIILVTSGALLLTASTPIRNFEDTYMALHPDMVLRGAVWQLMTYLLVHAQRFDHILFNMLGLWMFGTAVEMSWGWRRFLQYYILTGVGAGLCAMLTDNMTMGASGAVFGVLVAFGMLFPEDIIYVFFIIPMKAKHAVALFIILELSWIVGMPSGGISYAAHLGGAFTGWLYMKYSWRFSIWWKRSKNPGRPRMVMSREAPRAGRGREPATPLTSVPAPRNSFAASEEAAIQKRADEILDKISREGMDSLTPSEREVLQRHSQILKQREGDVVRLDDYRS